MSYPIRAACAPLLALFLLSSGCDSASSRSPVRAAGGILDLSSWNFADGGTVSLDGEWEFYWMRFVRPGGFADPRLTASRMHAAVPESWTRYRLNGKTLPQEGFASYRLVIKTGGYRGPLALRIREINTAFRFFAGGVLVCENGVVAESDEAMRYDTRPRIAYFQAEGGDLELVFHVSNYKDTVCGILRSLTLGTPARIQRERDAALAFDLFLFGSLLVMGVYHLGLFALRRRELGALYFGIFCLIIALRSIITAERFIYIIFPDLSWNLELRIEFLTLCGAQFFALFLNTLFRNVFNKAVFVFIMGAGAVFALITVFAPARIYIPVLMPFLALLAFAGIYGLGAFVAAAKRREGILLVIAGFVPLLLTMINDILHSRMIIQTAYLVPLGLFVFILLQSFLLAYRYRISFSRVEEMTARLEKYATHLEDMVRERTDELETQKDVLQNRNETIEKDLAMARTIQQQLIPHTSPVGYVHSLYRPMDFVGGDFYDFIRFGESSELGVFLSDVTGHGVPATLVTSMIKSIILQPSQNRHDPASFLAHLNSLLANQTGGNFVTAFYAVFNPETREITYANAGHHPPLLISNGSITPLCGKRGAPLAIFSGEELLALGKGYVSNRETLPAGSRLLLYTDGLVEIGMGTHGNAEERDAVLADAIREHTGLPGEEFLGRLIASILRRSGSAFEDDVCAICLDA